MEKYVYSIDIKVRDYELDAEGIVNNANYLHYLEYTRHYFRRKYSNPMDSLLCPVNLGRPARGARVS